MADPKSYTDYLLTVYGAGDNNFTDVHVQITRPPKTNGGKSRALDYMDVGSKTFIEIPPDAELPGIKLRNIKYAFDGYQDWSWWTKFSPWRKTDLKHPLKSMIELTRTKRIGHLHYLEPCDQGCAHCEKYKEHYPKCKPDVIEPTHFSRIHQPSGRKYGEPMELVDDWEDPKGQRKRPSLIEIVTPAMLQNRVEKGPLFYKEQYKSYRYGIIQAMSKKWYILVIGIIIAVIVLMYLSGNLGGR